MPRGYLPGDTKMSDNSDLIEEILVTIRDGFFGWIAGDPHRRVFNPAPAVAEQRAWLERNSGEIRLSYTAYDWGLNIERDSV